MVGDVHRVPLGPFSELMVSNQSAARKQGWSSELLTLLGAVLAVGVGLAGLILNLQVQVRDDMHAMETRIREDMAVMERRIREDVRELRGDVGELRERVSHLEGRFDGGGNPTARLEEAPRPTSPG